MPDGVDFDAFATSVPFKDALMKSQRRSNLTIIDRQKTFLLSKKNCRDKDSQLVFGRSTGLYGKVV